MQPTMLTEKTLPGVVACEHDIRDLISELVHIRGSQKAVAQEFGISKRILETSCGAKSQSGQKWRQNSDGNG